MWNKRRDRRNSVDWRPVAMILAVIGLIAAGIANANANEPDAKKEARTHFRAGTAFYDGGDYDRAIAEYEIAYKLLPLPDLLFNLGQAYRLKGNNKAAVEYYKRYLDAKPTGAVADEARAHLAELTPQPAAKPPSIRTTTTTTTTTPPPPTTTTPPPTVTPDATLSHPATAPAGGPSPVAVQAASPQRPAAVASTPAREPRPVAAAKESPPAITQTQGEMHGDTHRADTRRRKTLTWIIAGGSAIVVVAIGIGLGVGLSGGTKYPATTFGEAMPR